MLLQPGLQWTLTHDSTHLQGTISQAVSARAYASRRTEGLYRPFPEGVFPGLVTSDAEGEVVFEGTNPIWARHLGIPPRFASPVHLTIRGGFIREFRGGPEADQLRDCYSVIAGELGEEAYRIRGVHGGVHPYAHVGPHQCPDEAYRTFIDHHHWSSVHVHLGNSQRKADFPYNMHVTAAMRGASLQVSDRFVWERGRLTSVDSPIVQQIAARYPDRPGLDASRW